MADKLGLSAAGRKLFSSLRVARTPDELQDSGLPPELLSAMRQHGLLEPLNETVAPADHQDIYVNWPSQRGMLLDHTRTLAFQRAIDTVVRPGDRVVDVGTGSGILAMLSAKAGAGKVYGLEFTEMAAWAQKLADENGLDAMEVVRGDASVFEADAPVDVVLGEFAGFFLIDEWRHYAAFCKVRDRNLKPGGKVLPHAGRLYLSAVDSRKLYLVRGYGFWEAPVYGLDFSAVRDSEIANPQRYVVSADQNDIIDCKEIGRLRFPDGHRIRLLLHHRNHLHLSGGGAVSRADRTFPDGHGAGAGVVHRHRRSPDPLAPGLFPRPGAGRAQGGRGGGAGARSFLDPETGIQHFGIAVAGPGERLDDATPEHRFRME